MSDGKEQPTGDVQNLTTTATATNIKTSKDGFAFSTDVQNVDGNPASRKEVWAWYFYDWANSPYAGIGFALLIPLLVLQLTEEYACTHTKYGCDTDYNDIETGKIIRVMFGALELKPVSYTALIIGLASLIQAFFYIWFGSIADFANYRKILFRWTAFGGSILCIFFVAWGDPSLWQFVGWYSILVSVIHGLSGVYYNSYLPILVENHRDVIQAAKDKVPNHELQNIIEKKTDELSMEGFAFGFAGAIFVIILVILLLFFDSEPILLLGEFGNSNAFNSSSIESFSQLWAKKVTNINVYSSNTTTNISYINGIQFNYADINGSIYGSSSDSLRRIIMDDGCDEVIVYTANNEGYITGISFHIKGDDSDIYQTVGSSTSSQMEIISDNAQPTEDEKDFHSEFILAGMNGIEGELIVNDLQSGSEMAAVSELTFLFMHKEGQFYETTLFERIGICFTGVWWFVFTIVTVYWIKDREGAPFPLNFNKLTFGFVHGWKTLQTIREYPELCKYILAYFMFSDGIMTFISTGFLFARILLNFSAAYMAICALEVYVVAIFGSWMFLKIQKKYDYSAKQMLMFHCICFMLFAIWPVFGTITGSSVGLKSATEMFIYTFVFSLHIASIQSYARAIFSQLSPLGHESEMFAVYEITNKGSSWIGPLVVAAVSNMSDIRWSLFYIFLFFALPMPILWWLDVEKGICNADRAPEQVLERMKYSHVIKKSNEQV